jgi:hypothetical protein
VEENGTLAPLERRGSVSMMDRSQKGISPDDIY